ncbi:hypothetical protein GCM10022409_13550 [Hymenobacter glaciei]|uniref:Uncharacterized protein n=1 Tax=Hymenobacter glaciei TaxID=877209 RepID=A0ABP7TSH9_9BACT
MWSNYYDYYEIRASASYGLTADTKQMQTKLDAMPELKRVGLMNYKNAAGYPWIDLLLAKGRAGGFASSNDTWHDEFDMIPIVCSKSENGSVPTSQIAFLVCVAKTLGWELINEEDDAGQEDIIVWKPI